MTMLGGIIDGIAVTYPADMSRSEAAEYVARQKAKHPDLCKLDIAIDGEFVDLRSVTEKHPFDRLRRITGYLVGTMDRWNNAKRAEEADRVKHAVE